MALPPDFTGYRCVTMPAPNMRNALGDVVSVCILYPGMKVRQPIACSVSAY
jgi:hypothetical protein